MTQIYERVWAALPFPVVVVGDGDVILDVNPSGETFFNLSRRVIVGQKSVKQLLIGAEIHAVLARARSRRSPTVMNDVEITVVDRMQAVSDLRPRLFTLYIDPLDDHLLTLMIVVSPHERLDTMLFDRGGGNIARSVIGMAESLAHEIKNPLAGISGAAQLLSMTAEIEDQHLADLIVLETRRIVRLIDQVEQFGRQRPPELRPVNLHDALERARKSAQVGFAVHINFVEDYDPSLPLILADEDQLTQVFMNLIKNAAEACKDGGTVCLRSFYDISGRFRSTCGDFGLLSYRSSSATIVPLPLVVEITDDGPGVPTEIAADIFSPFVSGRPNGTGLGLALVAQILLAHGSMIRCDSVPGRTTFQVAFPVAPSETSSPMATGFSKLSATPVQKGKA